LTSRWERRSSIIFIEKGNVDVLDGAFVVVDKNGNCQPFKNA
jgi:hypothetical protein